jgi:phage tail protein X
MMRYITNDGDMVDAICALVYGSDVVGIAETVLEMNPGLAAYGEVLPAGVEILLPEPKGVTAPAVETVRLW